MLFYKRLSIVLLFLAYLFIPFPVFAADTCCVGHGGDYACDFSTKQLYCKDGSVSTACTCQAAPTPTPKATPIPTPTPTITPTKIPTITPTPPACPSFASYSAGKHACTCNAGYVVSNNTCVSYAQYCRMHYGNNAVYNSASNACACSQGYTWNANGSTCITMDALCSEKLGNKSYYNSTDNNCYCYQGYAVQNNQCAVIPTAPPPPATVAPTKMVQIVPPTQVPIPTIADAVIPNAPTTAPTKSVKPTMDLKKMVPGIQGYVAVKKTPSGFFANLLSLLWQVLLRMFNIY